MNTPTEPPRDPSTNGADDSPAFGSNAYGTPGEATAATPPPKADSATPMSTRTRVAIAALGVIGVVVLVTAALVGTRGTSGDTASSGVTGAVTRRIPPAGHEVLQQQQVGVVLDPRYRLTSLVVYPSDSFSGGVDVTAQVRHAEGLNLFEFAPGEGQAIESLWPDTNCAEAEFVLIARPEEADTARWCFEVS